MSDTKLVWSDEKGDLRKEKSSGKGGEVNEASLTIEVRRLTSGKGRTIIELKGLPQNKKWCQKLAKDIKKKLGVGGAYKNDFIEFHGEKLEQVTKILDSLNLKWKKVGG